MTKKESEFAYISDTEEISGSGWEVFNDCGTEAFHDENSLPPTKKSKDTTKVVRTYKLKRILRVDRQPDSTDNEDEANSPDTDMWRALTGVVNSAETKTGRSLLYWRFTNIKAIPGEPLSDFFGSLQETVGLLAGTEHAIPPY